MDIKMKVSCIGVVMFIATVNGDGCFTDGFKKHQEFKKCDEIDCYFRISAHTMLLEGRKCLTGKTEVREWSHNNQYKIANYRLKGKIDSETVEAVLPDVDITDLTTVTNCYETGYTLYQHFTGCKDLKCFHEVESKIKPYLVEDNNCLSNKRNVQPWPKDRSVKVAQYELKITTKSMGYVFPDVDI